MADQSVTLATATSASGGIKIERLSAEQTRQTGFTHRWKIPFDVINNAAWTAQGDTVTVTLGSTGPDFLIDKAVAVVTTAFATTGTLSMQVGTTADFDNFLDDQSVKTAAVLIGLQGADPVTEAGTVGVAAASLVARFTTQASTGAPSNITAGSVDIMLGVISLDDIIA